jgi:hypothetical protein
MGKFPCLLEDPVSAVSRASRAPSWAAGNALPSYTRATCLRAPLPYQQVPVVSIWVPGRFLFRHRGPHPSHLLQPRHTRVHLKSSTYGWAVGRLLAPSQGTTHSIGPKTSVGRSKPGDPAGGVLRHLQGRDDAVGGGTLTVTTRHVSGQSGNRATRSTSKSPDCRVA